MKKIFVVLILVLLVSCQAERPADTQVIENKETIFKKSSFTDDQLDYYTIEARLSDKDHMIDAKQMILYTNREETNLDELFIHTYPNAFSIDGQESILKSNKTDPGHGALEVSMVKINDEIINFEEGPTVTSIRLPYKFDQGATYNIELEYKVKVSNTAERFGVVDGIYNLCNWYPIIAVYDEDGWNVDPYYRVGDPFYSDVSNYDVTFTVPSDFTVAGSGYISRLNEGDSKTYYFRGDRMRDFAMVLSNQFMVKEEQVNDTSVYLYYPKKLAGHDWLDYAMISSTESLKLFEDIIGDYPYKTYSVVMTNFSTGMEYPGLVLISTGYFTRSLDDLRRVIVHETVHQWFYGIIGGDEIDEGWIDEGLTSYFTAYYDKKIMGEDYYYGTMDYYQSRVDNVGANNIVIMQSAKDFQGWDTYGLAAYTKPALLYHYLHETYGDKKIERLASTLYDKYAYTNMKAEDLRETIVDLYGGEIEDILDKWWY